MNYSAITLEKSEGVATITMIREDQLNPIGSELVTELSDAFEQVANDGDIRVLILTGTGRVFCAGGDIDWFRTVIEKRKSGEELMDYSGSTKFCLSLRNMPKPTIASINGAAVGGGITIALNCDIRIAAEDATIMFPFASLVGVTPELGSTYMLPRLVGIAKACELIFTGKSITGREAKEIGLVNDAVPLTDLPEVTSKMAKAIAKSSPLAVQLAKKGLYQGLNADIYSQLMWEEEGLRTTFISEDHEEAVNAFLEKRKPVFKGKR